jgi:GAF domain-containing protein
MELIPHRAPAPKSNAPPLWYVTDGDTTVGPLRTDLLVRGVRAGRIPDDCQVREVRWEAWRRLEQVREIRAVYRSQEVASAARQWDVLEHATGVHRLLACALDAREVLLFGLHAAALRTGAQFGLVHRMIDALLPPVTTFVHGPGLTHRLGCELPATDLMLGAARGRRSVVGDPNATSVHRAAAERLAGSPNLLKGIAMSPIHRRGELIGFFELGRSDHPFRTEDEATLRDVAAAIAARLERMLG